MYCTSHATTVSLIAGGTAAASKRTFAQSYGWEYNMGRLWHSSQLTHVLTRIRSGGIYLTRIRTVATCDHLSIKGPDPWPLQPVQSPNNNTALSRPVDTTLTMSTRGQWLQDVQVILSVSALCITDDESLDHRQFCFQDTYALIALINMYSLLEKQDATPINPPDDVYPCWEFSLINISGCVD